MATLKIRVSPGARRDEIVGWLGDVLRVRVKAPPERGKANDAAIALIAAALDVHASAVTLVRGATSRDKLLRIEELNQEDLPLLVPPGRRTQR
jgi:uncharacterized protein (TIGR00251 family)